MKILSGRYKGHKIITRNKLLYRPTKSRVRKSIFDRLMPFNYSLVLDLFSGSGILGFEAASRGASHVTFVEKNSQVMELIKKNSQNKDGNINFSFYKVDAFRYIKSCNKFDLIMADPPYKTSNIKKIINSCLKKLNIGGKFVLETDSNHSFNSNAKQINFGSTKIHIWNN